MIVHHSGIIVKELDKNISLYQKLGYDQISGIVVDHIQQNKVVFF